MKTWIGLLLLVLTVIGLTACGDGQPVEELPEFAGPALVMFYTEN